MQTYVPGSTTQDPELVRETKAVFGSRVKTSGPFCLVLAIFTVAFRKYYA